MNKKRLIALLILSTVMINNCVQGASSVHAEELTSTVEGLQNEYLPDDPDPNAGYNSEITVDKNSNRKVSVSNFNTSITSVAGTYVWPNNDVTMVLYSGITVYALTYTTNGQFYVASKRGYGFTNTSVPSLSSVEIVGGGSNGLTIMGTFPQYGQTQWNLSSSTSTSLVTENFGTIPYTADPSCKPKRLYTIPKGYSSYYQAELNNGLIVTFVLANSNCYNYSRSHWQAFTVDKTEKKFRPYINSYNVTFNYRTPEGSTTSLSKTYSDYIDTASIQPEPPEDKLNYMSFKQWDRKPGEVYRNTVYNAKYEEAEDSFWEDGLRYGILETSLDNNTVTLISCGDKTDVDIPKEVTHNGVTYKVVKLQSVAFKNNPNVTSVKIPEGVTEIDNEEFMNCSSLKEVSLPEKLKTIGNSAFKNTSLKEVTIPDSVEKIGVDSFKGTLLENVELPSELKDLGKGSFQIDSLEKVILNSDIVPEKDTFSSNLKALKVKTNFNADLQANLPGNYLEVLFQDSKEFNFTLFSKWYVKNAESAVGLQEEPSHIGYIFKNWGASLNNITQSMRYEAVYVEDPNKGQEPEKPSGGTGTGSGVGDKDNKELKSLQVSVSKSNASNREEGVFAVIDNMEPGVKYYYTLDGSEPTTGSLLSSNGVINIEAPDVDERSNVILKVVGIKDEKVNTTITTKVITFQEKKIDNMKKVQAAKVMLNKTTAENRDEDVVCIISNKEVGADYYYTLDGTIPTKENGIKVNTNAIKIPAPDTDKEQTIVLSVAGFKDGEIDSDSTCEFITFKAKEVVNEQDKDDEKPEAFKQIVSGVQNAMDDLKVNNLTTKFAVQLKAFNAIPVKDKFNYTVAIEDFEKEKASKGKEGSITYKVIVKDKNGNEEIINCKKVIPSK